MRLFSTGGIFRGGYFLGGISGGSIFLGGIFRGIFSMGEGFFPRGYFLMGHFPWVGVFSRGGNSREGVVVRGVFSVGNILHVDIFWGVVLEGIFHRVGISTEGIFWGWVFSAGAFSLGVFSGGYFRGGGGWYFPPVLFPGYFPCFYSGDILCEGSFRRGISRGLFYGEGKHQEGKCLEPFLRTKSFGNLTKKYFHISTR